MKLVSHLTITSTICLYKIYYGDELYDINHLIELETNNNYTYSGDIYFLHEYNYNFFVKFNIGKEEHILEYNFGKYKSKYDLFIEKIDEIYVISETYI